MLRRGVSIFSAALAQVGAAAFANEPQLTDYSVAAIEYMMTSEQTVGSVKAGLLCLPSGSLRWRDIARPEPATLARHIDAALRDAGLVIPQPADPLYGDPALATRFRIRVNVEAVTLKLCVPGLGIGEKQPSSRGTVVIRWDTFDRTTRTKISSVAYEMPINAPKRDARSDSRLIDDAISASATLYARTQKTP